MKEQTEEPKVAKQVTFQQPKKPRKRLKGIMNQIKSQMEFYFGDSNMSKDRFMKQKLDNTSNGYLPLSTFLNFNKIKELTEEREVLAKSLRSSDMLEVSEDGLKVRRKTPVKILTQEDIDARTVYVEGFPKTLTHDWFHRKFSVCGKVTYVSLPRFKSTNDIKGFAFVEFETPEEAAKAIETLNYFGNQREENKLEEKVGGSIKQSSNLKYLKKRAAREGIEVTEAEATKDETATEEGTEKEDGKEGKKSKSKRKKKKRRSTQASQDESHNTTSVETESSRAAEANQNQRAGDAGPMDVSHGEECTKSKKSKKSKRKRKRGASHCAEDTAPDGSKTSADVAKLCKGEGDQVGSSDDTDSTVTKSKKTAGVTEALKNSGDSVAATKQGKGSEPGVSLPESSGDAKDGTQSKRLEDSSASDSQRSKKRRRPSEEESEPVAAKISRRGAADKDSTVTDTKSGEAHEEQSKDSAKVATGTAEGSDKGFKRQSREAEGDSDTHKDRKRRRDDSDTTQTDEASAKKQKPGKQPGQRRSTEQPDQPPSSDRKRKRKSLEAHEEGSKSKARRSLSGIAEGATEVEGEEGSRKKRQRKKRHVQTLQLALRVMSKKDWSNLKEEYLSLQKRNMQKLKEQLKAAARNKNQQNKQNTAESQSGPDTEHTTEMADKTNAGHPPPEFVPNAILEVKSDVGMCHQSIKEDVPPSVEVAYIDVKPGMTRGHIRCKDAVSASKLLQLGIKGCSLSLVEGVAEKAYWDKLISEREARLSKTKRPKRRGKNKLLQRAQNPLGEIFMGQHLKFNDNEENAENGTEKHEQMEDDLNAIEQK